MILIFDTEEENNKFTEIYEKYKKIVIYTVKRFIYDEFIAEDIFQDIFIIIGHNLEHINLDEEKRSRNYIITIARNYCISYLRKEKNSKEDLLEEIESINYSPENPLDNVINKESFQLLQKEIKKLSYKYRMVLELKYINEFEDDEIANFLGITKRNVQMRLYRAKLMLRERLGEPK